MRANQQSNPPAIVHFRVPNTPKGQRFIRDVRQYVNRGRYGEIAVRPRGGSRGRTDSHCQSHDAKTWGIYLRERVSVIVERQAREAEYSIPLWKHRDAFEEMHRTHKARLLAAQGVTREHLQRATNAETATANALDRVTFWRRVAHAATGAAVLVAALAFAAGVLIP